MSTNVFCCVSDFEEYALSTLPRSTADYYKSGAENEFTLRLNKEAFNKFDHF